NRRLHALNRGPGFWRKNDELSRSPATTGNGIPGDRWFADRLQRLWLPAAPRTPGPGYQLCLRQSGGSGRPGSSAGRREHHAYGIAGDVDDLIRCSAGINGPGASLTFPHVKPEMSDIPVLDHIIFSLKPLQSLLRSGGKRTTAHHEVFEARHLGADKVAFDIRVNLIRRFWRLRPLSDCPGPYFVLSGS